MRKTLFNREAWLCGTVFGFGRRGFGRLLRGRGANPINRDRAEIDLRNRLAGEDISDPARLPARGIANYAGFLRTDLPIGANGTRESCLADLALKVDFGAAANKVRDSAGNFATKQGQRMAGDLKLRGSTLFRKTDTDENYTFEIVARGELRKGDTPYDINA